MPGRSPPTCSDWPPPPTVTSTVRPARCAWTASATCNAHRPGRRSAPAFPRRWRMPPAADRRARGAAVEAAARVHLSRAGLRDVAANANYRFGELDLVMLEGATLVFVEVRYRRDARFGGGAASVDVRKRRKLVQAAHAFLTHHP